MEVMVVVVVVVLVVMLVVAASEVGAAAAAAAACRARTLHTTLPRRSAAVAVAQRLGNGCLLGGGARGEVGGWGGVKNQLGNRGVRGRRPPALPTVAGLV